MPYVIHTTNFLCRGSCKRLLHTVERVEQHVNMCEACARRIGHVAQTQSRVCLECVENEQKRNEAWVDHVWV